MSFIFYFLEKIQKKIFQKVENATKEFKRRKIVQVEQSFFFMVFS